MALLELSLITGTLAQMGLEKGFQALGRSEAAIRVRRRLKMPAEPDPADFGSLYRHALVDWGVFKPAPVLDFFRDRRIYDAFRRAHQTGDPTILDREAAEVVRWAEEFGVFGGLEYDPRREIAAFAATFDLLVAYTRPAADAGRDQAIAEQGRKLDEALALLAQWRAGGDAGAAALGDVHFSGQFQNVIINLLSELKDTRQVVGAAGGAAGGPPAPPPTPLPPLDEDGRPPLPDPAPTPPPGSRLPFYPNPLFTGREEELRQLALELLYDGSGGAGEQGSRGEGSTTSSELVVRRSSSSPPALAASTKPNWRPNSPGATAATSPAASSGSAWRAPPPPATPSSTAARRWASTTRPTGS
ncbi:hypothetical protein [Promineifilum sp.]|uniref:hypothetical protein n=1 Tax=Promineifilum sp. TaxID=2664178 RepID=UPI0035B2AD19